MEHYVTEREKTCTCVHIREVIVARETGKEVFMFTTERCIYSKNRSVGPVSVQNKEVFTNRGFTVLPFYTR